jgi:hypothetical protein
MARDGRSTDHVILGQPEALRLEVGPELELIQIVSLFQCVSENYLAS